MAKAMDVANYLIQLRDSDEERGQYYSLSNLKLQKLLYYCQGGHYKWDGKRLINDNFFEPWDYGPVIDEIYQEFKKFGQNDLPSNKEYTELSDSEIETIKTIWNQLKNKDAFSLVRSSHRESPWKNSYGKNIFIPEIEIEFFFKGG